MGLSASAGPFEWIAVAGFLAYVSFTLCWLGLAFGLAAKTVASASNGPFPLVLLPLVGSGIVPPQNHVDPAALLRREPAVHPHDRRAAGPAVGTPIGNSMLVALLWCTGIGVLGVVWSIWAFNRQRPERAS